MENNEQKITPEFIDFINLVSGTSNYKMIGKHTEEYMLEYIKTVNEKINSNISNIEELLNNTTDEFELLCIISTLVDNLDNKSINEVEYKNIFSKYKTELLEIQQLNNNI